MILELKGSPPSRRTKSWTCSWHALKLNWWRVQELARKEYLTVYPKLPLKCPKIMKLWSKMIKEHVDFGGKTTQHVQLWGWLKTHQNLVAWWMDVQTLVSRSWSIALWSFPWSRGYPNSSMGFATKKVPWNQPQQARKRRGTPKGPWEPWCPQAMAQDGELRRRTKNIPRSSSAKAAADIPTSATTGPRPGTSPCQSWSKEVMTSGSSWNLHVNYILTVDYWLRT